LSLNRVEHGLVHVVGFSLIGDQGFLLPDGPEADPFSQDIQVGEVMHPVVIQGAEHKPAVTEEPVVPHDNRLDLALLGRR
jgi:hypothetical protein